jgi:hypothetical protein
MGLFQTSTKSLLKKRADKLNPYLNFKEFNKLNKKIEKKRKKLEINSKNLSIDEKKKARIEKKLKEIDESTDLQVLSKRVKILFNVYTNHHSNSDLNHLKMAVKKYMTSKTNNFDLDKSIQFLEYHKNLIYVILQSEGRHPKYGDHNTIFLYCLMTNIIHDNLSKRTDEIVDILYNVLLKHFQINDEDKVKKLIKKMLEMLYFIYI